MFKNAVVQEEHVRNIIIGKLNALGFREVEGKSLRELKFILAAKEISIEAPESKWF